MQLTHKGVIWAYHDTCWCQEIKILIHKYKIIGKPYFTKVVSFKHHVSHNTTHIQNAAFKHQVHITICYLSPLTPPPPHTTYKINHTLCTHKNPSSGNTRWYNLLRKGTTSTYHITTSKPRDTIQGGGRTESRGRSSNLVWAVRMQPYHPMW